MFFWSNNVKLVPTPQQTLRGKNSVVADLIFIAHLNVSPGQSNASRYALKHTVPSHYNRRKKDRVLIGFLSLGS